MQTLKNKLSKFMLILALSAGFLMVSAFALPGVAMAADCNASNNREIRECLKENKIIKRINQVVRVLSAGVGIVIVASIVWGGLQYVMAGNSPNEISSAKQRIQNSVLALLVFIFMFALIEWLIPGEIYIKL